MRRSEIMHAKWREMIDAFSALTPEERKAEAETRALAKSIGEGARLDRLLGE